MKLLMIIGALLLSWQVVAQANSCEDRAAREYEWALRECRNESGPPPYTPPPHNPPSYKCVPKCELRWSDGSCGRYGADFCGPNAACVLNCELRWSDGSCGRYGEDICYAASVPLDAKKLSILQGATKVDVKKISVNKK